METLPTTAASPSILRHTLAAGIGAIAVALAAQVAIPLPGTPIPFTLQPLMVLLVGALLGPRAGFASLMTYLAAGAAGLPVFAGGAAGAIHLFGPTGGYLLAFPLAAAVTGFIVGARTGKFLPTLLGAVVGMIVIHAGGLAMLYAMTGSTSAALAHGVLPFLVNDVLKCLAVAGLGAVSGRQVLRWLMGPAV